mgnify:CR=1 FL=1|tara:strand:+ start:16718 stop:17839 length:1122 start_codon:yes stop_codon:yes gene_type:complete
MAKLLQLRRGTTTEHNSFTGAEGECTVDKTKDTLVVHDGSTQGGFPLAREDLSNATLSIVNAQVNASAAIAGSKISPDFGAQNVTTTGVGTFASLDISGNTDVDGTLEADAYTVDGTALNEYIADTVGAMVGSNDETGITVTYEDSDNTLDFVITSIPGVTFTGDVTYDNGTNAGKDIIWDESDNQLEFTDTVKASFGTDGDADISHDDTDFYIDNDKGNLYIRNNVAADVGGDIYLKPHDNEDGIKIVHDGGVFLYYDNSEKLETVTGGVEITGDLTATGNVTAYSDERLKTDVNTIESALDKVTKLRGVEYTKIDTNERGIGVIAQEIEQVLPEVVQDGSYKSVAYGNVVGVLIEAIKELKSEIDELKGGE